MPCHALWVLGRMLPAPPPPPPASRPVAIPPPSCPQVYASKELSAVLKRAQKLQKERGDAYLGVDTLLLAALGDGEWCRHQLGCPLWVPSAGVPPLGALRAPSRCSVIALRTLSGGHQQFGAPALLWWSPLVPEPGLAPAGGGCGILG